jgi:KDO2-lipid IV(A) lauroyltransferase
MQSKEQKPARDEWTPPWTLRVRRRIERGLGIFMYRLARRMSRRSALRLANSLGSLIYRMFRKYRMVCVDGLTIAFGDKYSYEEKIEIARKSQTNLARTVMDFLRFEDYSREEMLALCVDVSGKEHMEKAIERSKGGVIGLTGHLGSWEYCGAWVVASGWNLCAVGKEQRDPGITKLMLDLRSAVGIKHIPTSKRGNLDLIRALKSKNTILGLLSDQNGGRDGIFVDFFGLPASSVRGPAFLALRYDVPVVPIFALWEGDNYRIEILPEVELARSGDEEADILENTQRFQKVIEGMVRKYPEQWLWAHRRWKTRPPGEPPVHLH